MVNRKDSNSHPVVPSAGAEFKINNQDGRIGQSDSLGTDPHNVKDGGLFR